MVSSAQGPQIHEGGGGPEDTSYIPLLCFLSVIYIYCLYRYSSLVQKPPASKSEPTPVRGGSTDIVGVARTAHRLPVSRTEPTLVRKGFTSLVGVAKTTQRLPAPRVEPTPVREPSMDLVRLGGEGTAMAEDMDELSLQLAIALQLKDVEVVMASRKGKGRAGDAVASNDEAAFNDYRRHLEISAQILLDQRVARSVDRAVRSDARELMRVTRAERRDESDRELALLLSEDPATKLVKNNSQWRPLAIGSGIEATDTDIEKWIQKSIEWDVKEPQNAGGPSTKNASRSSTKVVLRKRKPAAAAAAPSTAVVRKRSTKCAICMEDFAERDTVKVACAHSHSYCNGCMRQLFVGACRDEELFPPRCCRQEIPIDLAFPLLSHAEVEEFLDKTEEYTCSDRTYCFQPFCSRFIPKDHVSRSVGSCPGCFFKTCTLCKKERHAGDCPDDPSMKLTLQTAAENGWQRCQKCHAIVELAHGCQHMTCRCKAEWCYRCGDVWKTCQCNDWDEGHLHRRAEDLAIREVGENANPLVLAGLALQIRGDLQQHHECEHMGGWEYSRGTAQCEMCSYQLPQYTFVCSGCRLRACNRCRRNRI